MSLNTEEIEQRLKALMHPYCEDCNEALQLIQELMKSDAKIIKISVNLVRESTKSPYFELHLDDAEKTI